MAAKDKKLDIGTVVKNNANRILVVVMVVLLVLRIALYVTEAAPNIEAPPSVPEANLQATLGPESPNFRRVQEMTQQWEPFPESEYRQLGELNMFDPQRVRNAENIERQAQDLFADAKAAFDRRSVNREAVNEARRLVEEALEMNPSHQNAKLLREQIEQFRATGSVAPISDPNQPAEGDATATPDEPGTATPPGEVGP